VVFWIAMSGWSARRARRARGLGEAVTDGVAPVAAKAGDQTGDGSTIESEDGR
jgi:hypothetical protein